MIVLDASALLAALLDEPGKARVDAVIGEAQMTTVNLAEVVGHFAKAGAARADIVAMLDELPLAYVAPDEALAIEAGLMRRLTEKAGLSLGDRICLALARRLGATALTADRAWASIAEAVGVEIEQLR